MKSFWWVPAFAGMTMLACRFSFAETPATITSDDLEIRNNGDVTIFSGHVILKQDPYEVHSDRMIRKKATEIVDAEGHVVGNWLSPKGDKVHVLGEKARYKPAEQTVEVWGREQVRVDLDGEKGKATFHGDKGWVFTQQPGKARLIGNVTGHVIPSGAS